jgi:hypothetical protein
MIFTFRSGKVYRCPRCSWFRVLTDDFRLQNTTLMHPLYGKVTLLEVAQRDVERHDCYQHELAKLRVQERNKVYA